MATYQYDITQVIIPAIGQVRVREATIPLRDRLFADVEHGRLPHSHPCPDQRMPNQDLEEFIDLLLGTGCREGEGLAIRPIDLHDLDGPVPTLHICGTVIEPERDTSTTSTARTGRKPVMTAD